MGFSTADCVAELNKIQPGDWKCKSKSGNAKWGVVRVFENRNTGAVATVIEKDGRLKVQVDEPIATIIVPKELDVPAQDPYLEGILKRSAPEPAPAQPPAPPAQAAALSDADAQATARRFFGPNPTTLDYRLLAGTISLRANLPPSFATTAMVNALKGTLKGPVAQKNPFYGILAGTSIYTRKQLWDLVEGVQKLLNSSDVCEEEGVVENEDKDEYAPCFLSEASYDGRGLTRVNKKHALAISKVFEDCAAKYGTKAPEIVRKETNKVSPKDIEQKFIKLGLLKKARTKAAELMEQVKKEHPDWEPGHRHGGSYHSKSIKGDVLTMCFYIDTEQTVRAKWKGPGNTWKTMTDCMAPDWEKRRQEGETGQATVLVTKWDKEGKDLIEWNVELREYKGW